MSALSTHRAARLAILIVGAIGVLVAARTAAFYVGVDRFALSLSLLIAAGLSFGIAELLGRVGRAERTLAELARLPRPATLEAIDATSAPLRAVLRARLHGTRATIATAGFAAYLTGLLVMIGLLGTFLGLVEALRGTREALGTSTDIDALRAALSTPMLGLSRAFGTSAAGVTASAMLGLAAVFARRTETALGEAVHAYADDALGPLTVSERQLALLEALVRQSAEASAAAARATQAVEATAQALRADVATGVAGVATAVERALTPSLERAVVRASDVTRERLDDWTRTVEREADLRRARDEALANAWTELAGESADRVAREGSRALGELRGVLGESLASLDARLATSVDALAGQLGARTRSISDDLDARLADLTTAVGAMIEGLSGELDRTRARLDRTLEVTTSALESHAERSVTREQAREEAIAARMASLAGAEAQALTRLERHVDAVDASLAKHLERVTAMQHDVSRDAAARAVAVDAALSAHLERITAMHDDVSRDAAARATGVDASLAKHLERITAMHDDVSRDATARATAVDATLAKHLERALALQREASREAAERAVALDTVLRDHAASLTTTTGAVLAEAARRADDAAAAAERAVHAARDEIAAREASERAQAERAQALLSGLAAAAEQVSARAGLVLTEQAERQTELEARWLTAHDESAARLVALLDRHAQGLADGLTATRALVDDASGLLRASGVEMGAVAEVFTAAVDRYRDASDACLGALANLDDAVDRAGKKAAIDLLTDYLEQTREVFEHSLEVQRELFAELRALRARAGVPEKTRVRA